MYGNNPIRKQELGDGKSLWIQEVFYTIQGEGPWAGHPAVFIRLGGCNLACTFCDTDFESSDWHPTIEEIHKKVIDVWEGSPYRPIRVVLTGGEPFRQNVMPLIKMLNSTAIAVQVETNGTLMLPNLGEAFVPRDEKAKPRAVSEVFDTNHNTIVVSPKTKNVNKALRPYVDAYKYILRHGDIDPIDGLPAASTQIIGQEARLYRPNDEDLDGHGAVEVYVQAMDMGGSPFDAENQRNLKATAAVVMKHGYRLSFQSHKIIGLD